MNTTIIRPITLAPADLNTKAVELVARIQQNFEGLL
jgi:hypothetical protein